MLYGTTDYNARLIVRNETLILTAKLTFATNSQ